MKAGAVRFSTVGSLAGLALAFGLGGAAHATGTGWLLDAAGLVEPLGQVWVRAFQMIVLPLVLSYMVVAIAGERDGGRTGRMGGIAFALFAAFMVFGVALTLLLALPVLGRVTMDEATRDALRSTTTDVASGAETLMPPFGEWIVNLVPTNPVSAAAEGDLLPFLVFVVLFALAVSRVSGDGRRSVVGFFEGIAEATMVIVEWILVVMPIGVFALAFPMTARAGLGLAGQVGVFVGLTCGILLLLTALLYPVAILGGGVDPRRFARAVVPAQTVAVGTRSSLASLPALIEGAERRLGLPANVTGFVLPLAASAFKINISVSSTVQILFLVQLYGLTLAPGEWALFGAAIVAKTFGSPGIPSGSTGITLPLYLGVGIPMEGLALLYAVDAVPDIFKTLANVTGDMTVATVVARFAGRPVEIAERPAAA